MTGSSFMSERFTCEVVGIVGGDGIDNYQVKELHRILDRLTPKRITIFGFNLSNDRLVIIAKSKDVKVNVDTAIEERHIHDKSRVTICVPAHHPNTYLNRNDKDRNEEVAWRVWDEGWREGQFTVLISPVDYVRTTFDVYGRKYSRWWFDESLPLHKRTK